MLWACCPWMKLWRLWAQRREEASTYSSITLALVGDPFARVTLFYRAAWWSPGIPQTWFTYTMQVIGRQYSTQTLTMQERYLTPTSLDVSLSLKLFLGFLLNLRAQLSTSAAFQELTQRLGQVFTTLVVPRWITGVILSALRWNRLASRWSWLVCVNDLATFPADGSSRWLQAQCALGSLKIFQPII